MLNKTSKISDKPITLTSEDSDVGSTYKLPSQSQPNQFGTTGRLYVYPYDNNYGAYYSWDVATAGDLTNRVDYNASYSICPKNFRLPSYDDIDTIKQKYTFDQFKSPPANFTAFGQIQGTSLLWCQGRDCNSDNGRLILGIWWTSRGIFGSNSVHALGIFWGSGYSNWGPDHYSGDALTTGRNIRCVKR